MLLLSLGLMHFAPGGTRQASASPEALENGAAAADDPAGDPVPSEPFLRGDANVDGKVTFADVFAILEFVYQGGVLPCKDAADTDDSGRVEASDAWMLLALFLPAGGEPALPRAPYPESGSDPTEDTLDCVDGRRGRRVAELGAGVADPADDGEQAVVEPVRADPCDIFQLGAELEFIHFSPGEIWVFPGQRDIFVDLVLETTIGELEGLTVSLGSDPAVIEFDSFDLGGDAVNGIVNQASRIETRAELAGEGHLAGILGINVQTGEETLPATPRSKLAELSFHIADDAPVGAEFRVDFDPYPGLEGRPAIPTEFIRGGQSEERHGLCPLIVHVVPRSELYLRGDADRDGDVTLADALRITEFLFGGEEDDLRMPCMAAADANDDRQVTFPDAVNLLRYLFLQAAPPFPPYPYWGQLQDSPSRLSCEAATREG